MARRSALHALAERAGILSSYTVAGTRRRKSTSDETRVALLAALGFNAADETAARRSLGDLEAAERQRLLEPTRVVREQVPSTVPTPTGAAAGGGRFGVAIKDEDDVTVHAAAGRSSREGSAAIRIPPLPAGVYRLELELDRGDHVAHGAQTLVAVPRRCVTPAEVADGRFGFGLQANLYTVRSEGGFGVGDLGDLAELMELAAEHGAMFVGINPLHVLRNRSGEVSPYAPVSRLFRNPIYLDVEAVPELTTSSAARDLLSSASYRQALAELRAGDRVDYERVAGLQRPVLEALHDAFGSDAGAQRRDEYERFKQRGGRLLADFATFAALEEHLCGEGQPRAWRRWPGELSDPTSGEVARFRSEHAGAVDFHTYVQFELDRQLGRAATHGREHGLAIGLYTDLAVGTQASGFDAWAFPRLFVEGVSLGAPPDAYSATGQDWGIPPVHPHRLAEDGYRYWRLLLAASFEHAGMVRLDHAMGLTRQYWVPAGCPATEGAYVRFPVADLLGLVALESRRHRALVVGEDLGTVPRGFKSVLAAAGVLSTQLVLFERTEGGSFRPPAAYSRRALASLNTHDQPPLACYWRGDDLALRRRLGFLPDDESLARAAEERSRELGALVRRLIADGNLADPAAAESHEELCRAINTLLSRTPAPLVSVSLDDLAAEREPVNVPGVSGDRYPSWTRRMRRSLAELREDPSVARMLEPLSRVRGRGAR